jgi:hypothetical protein
LQLAKHAVEMAIEISADSALNLIFSLEIGLDN